MTIEPLPAHKMIEVAVRLRDAMWGTPLVALLAGMGLYLTILLRGLQLRRVAGALRLVAFVRDEPDADGDISHVDALCLGLAGTLGTGAVVGVAAALLAGGPGAVFWMWMTAVLMMAVQFSEAVLGVRFRETDVRGEKSGGPMHYLAGGLRWGGLGRGLAILFAAAATLAAFGVGNSMQVHALTTAATALVGIPRMMVGAIVALLAGALVLGGVRPITRALRVLVPAMVSVYVVATAWVLVEQGQRLPSVLADVMQGAFGDVQAIVAGIMAGIVTSQAGIGTAGIAAAAARTREPVRQALIAMLQAPITTLVVATMTALAFLVSGRFGADASGVETALGTIESAFPAAAAGWLAPTTVVVFAFTSIVAWAYFGERCIQYLAGSRAVVGYRVLYVGVLPLGAVLRPELAWDVVAAFHGFMALPNLVGLFLLSGIVVREAKAYVGKAGGRQPSKRL